MSPSTVQMTKLTKFSTSPSGVAILFFGPIATLLVLPFLGWDPLMLSYAQWLSLLVWSPLLPFGVPALLLQDERDVIGGPLRPLGVIMRLFVAGPPRVVAASWANATGVAIALVALTAFM